MKSIKNFIWAEKYRPSVLSEVILEDSIKAKLEAFINKQDLPHLLIHGHVGSGKTTVANILIKLFDNSGKFTLLLNGAKDKMEVFEEKLEPFLTAKTTSKKALFKIVFIDNIDRSYSNFQKSIETYMETHSNARFIFTATKLAEVEQSLRSKCIDIHLHSIPKPKMEEILKGILIKEGIKFDEADIKRIIARYYPDLRYMINKLQDLSFSGTLNLESDVPLFLEIVNNTKIGNFVEVRKLIQENYMDFSKFARFIFFNTIKLFPEINPIVSYERMFNLLKDLETALDPEITILNYLLLYMKDYVGDRIVVR